MVDKDIFESWIPKATSSDLKLLLKIIYFIDLQLIYNVLISAVPAKWFSYINVYSLSCFFKIMAYQNIEYSFLCYTVGPCFFIHPIYISLHLLIPKSRSFSPPFSLSHNNHKFALYVSESVSISCMCSFASYFRFHI